MNEAQLEDFRRIAAALAGPALQNWYWTGPHLSQRMFGITQARAQAYAARHGGKAEVMA
jgi:hypothetical protein